MSTDNNIKNFTGADIEKYHKGLLTAQERHDLEKAALDDPFLADALEGYAVAGGNYSADMDELKNRLGEKVESGNVIPMKAGGNKSFPWLRVAVMVAVIGVAGLIAAQFIFKENKKEIAQLDKKKTEEVKAAETAITGNVATKEDSLDPNSGTTINLNKQDDQTVNLSTSNKETAGIVSKDVNVKSNASIREDIVTNNATQPVVVSPSKVEDERNKVSNAQAEISEKNVLAKEDFKSKTEIAKKQEADADGIKDKIAETNNVQQNNKAVAASKKVSDNQQYRNQANNTFRGRVTNDNNVGLPFARVYNPTDNDAGTYTNVDGYFNLTYPDSVLTVQVKSIGFENRNVELRNIQTDNQIVLQDDKSLSEVVISSQKPNYAARSKEANKTLEEPEPADGWENYDTYLTNNLKVPEEIKTKQNISGQVKVSFEVNSDGEPANIRVEKSLCKPCDKEAIRLLKEGPKWKRNAAKKGRTTVTISF